MAKVKNENRFSKKLADANAFLAKAGVPKSLSKHSDNKNNSKGKIYIDSTSTIENI